MKNIRNILTQRIVVLDGATGTELQKRGMPSGVCPEQWCLENPDVLKAVHADYVAGGADIIYTATFGANNLKLSQHGMTDVRGINQRLAQVAKKSAGNKALVAGDIGPTGVFVEPFGPLVFDEAVSVFKEQVEGLCSGSVDLFVIETMIDIQEARAALIAVKEITDAFTMVTLTFEKDGRTLNGTDPVTALITLQSLGADAVGCNCSAGPEQMLEIIKRMRPFAMVPLVAKPNAGMPVLKKDKTVFNMTPGEFGTFAKKFVQAGAGMLGGCCGTTPEHIHVLRKNISGAKPLPARRKSLGALSSARAHIILEGGHPLVTVGECINPTGKKTLQEELREGKLALARHLAQQQVEHGATVLDVNAGVPGLDERETMRKLISALSLAVNVPLVIDSSAIDVVEKALRLYPGRALINSISAEKEKLERLLPLAARYGAMFIVLPLNDREVPETFAERKKIIAMIINAARKYGCTKSDMVIDGLAMSVSAHPRSALETMKTIQWASRVLKTNTICGLSNVSFGMPARPLINDTFRSILRKNGLSLVIENPLRKRTRLNRYAADVLRAKDKDASRYLAYCRSLIQEPPQRSGAVKKETALSPAEKMRRTIVNGNREDTAAVIDEALRSGIAPEVLVHDVMIPAMSEVGELFDRKEYFLPQLIAGAETMKAAFQYLEPLLKKNQAGAGRNQVVILSTVQGDIHDIGKNIVALMLRNHGFFVVDLGKDVGTEIILNEIRQHDRPIVGLSALMTTTMVNMKQVIDAANKEKLSCRFMLGGAVVTKSYAHSLGAEYAADSVEAVRVVKKLSAIGG